MFTPGLSDKDCLSKSKGIIAISQVEKTIKEAINTDIEIYVPGGDTERFVSLALQFGYMTVKQVLAIDCKIIESFDMVICYVPEGDKLQGGRFVEVQYAEDIGKPFCVFSTTAAAVGFICHKMMEGM